MSTILQALQHVDAIETGSLPQVAWKVDRTSVLARIRALIRQPELISQKGLNCCGPAVFFRVWFARDPLAAARFACDVLTFGRAPIGPIAVQPGSQLLNKDYSVVASSYPNITPPDADWMLLAALRDSENLIPYIGEPSTVYDMAAGLTLPSTVKSWLDATSLYTAVSDQTNLVTSGSRSQLLAMIPTSEIILLVSSSIFDNRIESGTDPTQVPAGASLFTIPNHYVLLTAPISVSTNGAWFNVELWSWGVANYGRSQFSPPTARIWIGADDFVSKYFGALITQ